jgi:hypothetical protein
MKMKWLRRPALVLALVIAGPLAMAWGENVQTAQSWRTAYRGSAGLAPAPAAHPEAVVQVYGARTVRWRGIFAVHCWISYKPKGASEYTRYDVIGWRARYGGSALLMNDNGPDNYWYGSKPEVYADLRGAAAEAAITKIEAAIRAYPYGESYTTWPGPNSNTFVAYVARRVPELAVDLPPTAIGKDFLVDSTVFGSSPSGTGFQVSLFGLAGFTVGVEEGIEFNLLTLNFGVDPKSMALRLPGLGIVGF